MDTQWTQSTKDEIECVYPWTNDDSPFNPW